MLENLRRNSRSTIIYILFGVIIAVFIINFGPGGGRGIMNPVNAFAARVGSTTLNEQDYKFAYLADGGGQMPPQMAKARRIKEFVMDKLIERELLAQEAEEHGFSVAAKEAEDMVGEGKMMVLGVPRRIDGYVMKDGKFDYEQLKKLAQYQLGVSVARFIEIQRRELLADKMRELMRLGAKVSFDEVKTDFENKGLQVNLEYVKFPSQKYEGGDVAPAEIDAYVKAHGDELKKQYEERAFLYKKIDKQARLRHVLIKTSKDAKPEVLEAAKKQIEAAAAKVKNGTPFAQVAQASSQDDLSKKRGGLIGWRKKGFTGLGDALDTKIFAAKKGDVIGPEKIDRGFELILVEEFREGDVPLESAQREIAEEKVREEQAKQGAKKAAQAFLDQVKKGTKWEDALPKASPPPSGDENPAEEKKVAETGMFPRRGDVVGDIGVSPDLAKRAFALKQDEIAGPFEASGNWVVVKLKAKKEPDMADFEKRKAELVRELERTKWAEIVETWSQKQCTEAQKQGRLAVNDTLLAYEGSKAPAIKYEPCGSSNPLASLPF